MSKSRIEVLQGLLNAWGIHEAPGDAAAPLDALAGAIASSRRVELSAAQVVVSGGDGERASHRGAMDALCTAVPELKPHRWKPLLVRAIVVAAWPDGRGNVGGLLVAPWEAPYGQEKRHAAAIEAWRRGLGGPPAEAAEVQPLKLDELGQGGRAVAAPVLASVPTALRLEAPEAIAALNHLSNTGTGWAFHHYGVQLTTLLTAMVADIGAAGGRKAELRKAETEIAWLVSQHGHGHNWSGFSTRFLAAVNALGAAAAALPGVKLPENHLGHLTKSSGTGWNYDGNWAPQFYALLKEFRASLIDYIRWGSVHDNLTSLSEHAGKVSAEITDSNQRVRAWSASVSTTLMAWSASLSSRVATARPAEVDLLWWGQARYSNTRFRPYRKLARDEQLWIAAAEAAQLSVGLPAAPAAAFLVTTLEKLGHPVGEKRPVLAWMEAGYETLRANRTLLAEPLIALGGGDTAGLPVARLHGLAKGGDRPLPDHLQEAFVAPEVEIDLGDWATWIFHELLLTRRLA